MSRKDSAPESLGQQLGSQADTENRDVATDCRGEHSALIGKKRIPVIFIGTERTAHHHETIYVIRFGDLIIEIETSNLDVEAASLCFVRDGPWPFPLNMLQYNPSTIHRCYFGMGGMHWLLLRFSAVQN